MSGEWWWLVTHVNLPRTSHETPFADGMLAAGFSRDPMVPGVWRRATSGIPSLARLSVTVGDCLPFGGMARVYVLTDEQMAASKLYHGGLPPKSPLADAVQGLVDFFL